MSAIVRWAALSAVIFCLCAAPVRAQEAPAPKERRKELLEGTRAFRRILFDHRCTPLEGFDDLAEAPERTILIVLGNLDRLDEVRGGVAEFVKAGGAVLLASDRPVRNPAARKQLLEVSGVAINNETLISFFSAYKGLNYCPVVVPVNDASPQLLFDRDLQGNWQPLLVATNIPSHLRPNVNLPGTLNVLARLPGDCVYEQRRVDDEDFVDRNGLPFLVGGELGKGRVLVAADHSLFINEMMLPIDNNNVEFSYHCVRWLRGERPRDRVLFVDEGGIQTTFEIPLKSANPDLAELAELAFSRRNHLLKAAESELVRMEQSNTFNAAVSRLLNGIDNPPGQLFAILAVVFTLALIVYGLFRLGIFARFAHDRTTPTLAAAVGRNLPAAPLVDQRNYTMLRQGNLNEPAEALARRWLVAQGVAVPDGAGDEPPVTAKGGWWGGRGLRRRLRRVWLLARGRSRETIEPAGLWRLQRELEALEQARQRGEWQLRG